MVFSANNKYDIDPWQISKWEISFFSVYISGHFPKLLVIKSYPFSKSRKETNWGSHKSFKIKEKEPSWDIMGPDQIEH